LRRGFELPQVDVSTAWLRCVLLLHCLVIGAALGFFAALEAPPAWRALGAAAVATPLALAAIGLARRSRYTCQWLAIVLVVYIGGAAVEVVAHSGADPWSSVLLLAAVLELGCLLALTRRARPRAARE
jgi:uncharacterized membrane protein